MVKMNLVHLNNVDMRDTIGRRQDSVAKM